MTQRFEGHSLEEALSHAADALGVARHRIRHRVLTEKRGFLGGIKRIVIEAEVNPDSEEPAADAAPAAPPEPVAEALSREATAEPGPPRERSRGRGRRGGGARGERDGNRGPRKPRGNEVAPGDFSRFAGEIPEQTDESPAAAIVREWCEQVVELARLSVTVRTSETDDQIAVRLYGPDAKRFVDRGGELLDALQVLTNKALTGRKIEKPVEFDCDEFKERRVNDLGQQARDLADRVRRDGREQLLPAMSPIERRIVHVTLQDDADVTTESRGEGFFKRVAVVPRTNPAGNSEP